MKPIKIAGMCLLAILALNAAIAQATEIPKGPIKFTDQGVGEAELGTKVISIKCKSHSAIGEIKSAKGGTVTSTYKGCEVAGKGISCQSGTKAGEIVTALLAEEIGWINKSKNEVGSDFKPASGETLAKFVCTGVTKVVVYGSVIGKITSKINEMSTLTNAAFEESVGKNNPTKFEGAAEDVLLTEFPEEPTGKNKVNSAQTQKDTVKNTETVECSVKCKPDPAEISTIAVTCTTTACKTSQRPVPEYGRCEKKAAGSYKNSNCTEASGITSGKKTGQYEFEVAT